jgi:Flp pilus assembly protein TadD
MEHFGEKPKFEVNPIVEQKPFLNPAVQSFFTKWCEINDSIVPQFVTRSDWQERGIKGILEKRPDNKQDLYIPEDLQLWEMVRIMEVVDHDTFAKKPERKDEAKNKLLALGKTFKNAGTYIAQRLDKIDEGKNIASELSEEFYDYGNSLIEGKQSEGYYSVENMPPRELTPAETDEVDRFLSGDELYKSRKTRAEKMTLDNPLEREKFYEAERQKTLVQFFRTAKKAFELKGTEWMMGNKYYSESLKPWEDIPPVHTRFIDKIEQGIKKGVETPKREFNDSIFRRGLEKLVSEMKEKRGWRHSANSLFEKFGIDWKIEQQKLSDKLKIQQLKAELESVRQTGNITLITKKERQITDKIQKVIESFTYESNSNNPSEMIKDQYINCVGASALGGALMQEAGLSYMVGGVPRHSILFLVTSSGDVEWRDMLNNSINENLTDDMVDGHNKDGSPLTVADIVAFSKNPTKEGLLFDIKGKKYLKKVSAIKDGQRQFVVVFEPEYGQKLQILNNTGIALSDLGCEEEAAEAFHQAVALNPNYSYPYNNLGNALSKLNRYEEAIEAYRESIRIDPKYAYPYNGLGGVFLKMGNDKEQAIELFKKAMSIDPKDTSSYLNLGNTFLDLEREEEAIEVYHKALSIDPKFAGIYNNLGNALMNLNRKEEAIKAYKKFLDLADKDENPYLIERAKSIIEDSI